MNLQKLAYISIIILTIYYIGTDIKDRNEIYKNTVYINQQLKEFNKAQNKYFKSVDNHINFLQGTKKDINKLNNNFEHAKKVIKMQIK